MQPKKQTTKRSPRRKATPPVVGDFLIDAVKTEIRADLGPKVDVTAEYHSGIVTLWLSEFLPLDELERYANAFLWLPHVLAVKVKKMEIDEPRNIALSFMFELPDREAVLNMYN